MKKAITVFMSFALLITSLAFPGAGVSAAENDYGTTVTELTAGDNELYVYYPTPNAADTSSIKLTCTAPAYIVFGDGAMSQEESIAYATESGLAGLAAENGSVIIFAQPIQDDWSNEDAAVYGNVAQMLSDSSTSMFTNGIAESVNFITKATEKKIVGTQQRIYVYGIGSGADMIANNWLKKYEAPTFWGGTANVTMASATLEGLSDISGLADNDIPTVSINNKDEMNTALKEANTKGLFKAADTRDYTAQAKELTGAYRRQAGVLTVIQDYAEEGIVEKVETVTVNTAKDNVNSKETTTDINYITYYSKELDITSQTDKVPLVVAFHGGGNTAKYEAWATEWPEIAKENGFIAVCVDLHFPNHTATEIVDLIQALEVEYPCIDTTRIYASGFSMGSVKSWDLFQQYPEIFAGLAPMDGSFSPGKDGNGSVIETINSEIITPVFYVGGETSPLGEFPTGPNADTGETGDIDNIVGYALSVNNVTDDYSYDVSEGKWWGIKPDLAYTVTDEKTFTDSVLTVNLYQSEDGNYYTALANASNQSHEVYARNSWAAWDFLKQFSRNADGTITISSVEYALASDDSMIISNSYNASGTTAEADLVAPSEDTAMSDMVELTDIPKTGEDVLMAIIALGGMLVLFFLFVLRRKESKI